MSTPTIQSGIFSCSCACLASLHAHVSIQDVGKDGGDQTPLRPLFGQAARGPTTATPWRSNWVPGGEPLPRSTAAKLTDKRRAQVSRLLPLNEGQPSGWPARASRTVGRGGHPQGRNEVKEPRSGLTAAVDRARGRRLRAKRGPYGASVLRMVWCMRSGAVVCPASLIAAYHPPRACMGIRGSGPKSLLCARRHLAVVWFFPTPSR